MSRVLVLSPHPDDESIGCGGTLCQHVADGDEVRVVFLTSGEMGGHGTGPEDTRRVREAEAVAATNVLGLRAIEFWHAPDGRLRATSPLVARLAALLRSWKPDTVYTTHPGEAHPDHCAAPRLLRRALAKARVGTPEVWLFEIWTPLATMDRIVDVTRWMPVKLRAVRRYRSQCAVLRFDAAVAGLNRYRGEMHCWPEGDYAEVFARMKP
jgi:LmbE family N-acetylglucosaminyl deacetylase